MKIHWHKRAAEQLHQVEGYVLRTFGEHVCSQAKQDCLLCKG